MPTADKKSVTSEDDLVVAILHIIADAVLSMAWRVKRLDRNVANLELLVVLRGLGHLFAVLPADDVQGRRTETGENLFISAGVVPVALTCVFSHTLVLLFHVLGGIRESSY